MKKVKLYYKGDNHEELARIFTSEMEENGNLWEVIIMTDNCIEVKSKKNPSGHWLISKLIFEYREDEDIIVLPKELFEI